MNRMDHDAATTPKAHDAFRRIRASARLIWSLMDGVSVALLLLLAVLAFGYFRVLQQTQPPFTSFDLFVLAYNPTFSLSLLWLVCPAVTMILLARVWKKRERVNFVSRSGGRGCIWSAQVSDVVVVSALGAAIIHLSLLAIGLLCIGTPFNVFDPASLFAYYTQGQTPEGFSFPDALAIMFVYAFLALFFTNSLFLLVRSLLGIIPAFIIVVVLAYPEVHKPTALVHDIVSAYGGNILAVNPLSYIYETSSVFYPSWLPENGHALWFLCLLGVALVAVGRWVIGHREYL